LGGLSPPDPTYKEEKKREWRRKRREAKGYEYEMHSK
jgi:hypothetical protein